MDKKEMLEKAFEYTIALTYADHLEKSLKAINPQFSERIAFIIEELEELAEPYVTQIQYKILEDEVKRF